MKSFDGYLKKKLGNSYVLLAGGSHKALSDFSMNGHSHNFITGKDFYKEYSGYLALPSIYTPSLTLTEEGIDSRCFVFNAFTDNGGLGNSLFWGGYGKWGMTELRSIHGSNSHLYYRVAKSYNSQNTDSWQSFKTLANLDDLPTFESLIRPESTNDIKISIGGIEKSITLGSNAWNSNSYSLSDHTHNWIDGYNFYSTTHPWNTSYGPIEVFSAIGITNDSLPKVFAAFTYDNGYQDSLFWTGYGAWGLTELRLAYTNGNARLKYRTSTSNSISLWSNFHEIANLSDIPTITTGTTNGTISVGGTDIAVYGLGSNAYNSTAYLPLTGGTMSGIIYFNRKVDGGLIQNIYNNNYYNIIRSHNNGNISISASGGGLYLGYENTSIIYARGSYVNLDTGNLTASKSGQTLTITINETSYSLTNSTYSTFVASGSSAASGLVPKPDTTAGTVKFLCEDATWKKVDWSYLSGVPSSFAPSYHNHNYIRGYSFYENTSVVGSGHHALPVDWKPSQIMNAVCGDNDSIPAVFAAFSEPVYWDSLFWTGCGGAGLTELRSQYNRPTTRLLYRVAYGYSSNTWGNFYTIATTDDLPTKASWNYDDVYVKSVSISGTNLRVNKNGSNSDTAINAATLEGNSASAFASAGHTHDYAASVHYHSYLRHSTIGYNNAKNDTDSPATICNVFGVSSSAYAALFPGAIKNSGGTRYMSLYWTACGSPGLIELNSLYGADTPLRFRHSVGWSDNGANWYGFREIIDNKGGQTISGNLTATNFYTSSDINKKTNFAKIPEKELNFIQFTWKKSGLKSYGLVAQLVKALYPELVDGEDGDMTVNYSAALCLTVGQLQRKIKELEQRLRQLENLNK